MKLGSYVLHHKVSHLEQKKIADIINFFDDVIKNFKILPIFF